MKVPYAPTAAIAFLADPHALAREHMPDRPNDETVFFTLGVAEAHIEALLDALGFPENEPHRTTLRRMEWREANVHLYEDDEI